MEFFLPILKISYCNFLKIGQDSFLKELGKGLLDTFVCGWYKFNIFHLQEGPRYTAMHAAAMKNQPEICQAILDILQDEDFVSQLYSQSKNSEETLKERINFLVDLYLNMPDKGVLFFILQYKY